MGESGAYNTRAYKWYVLTVERLGIKRSVVLSMTRSIIIYKHLCFIDWNPRQLSQSNDQNVLKNLGPECLLEKLVKRKA